MDTRPCRFCAQPIQPNAIKCPHCLSRQPKTLHRGVPGKRVAGICAALADYLGIEVALVRVAFLLAVIFSGGLVFSAYLGLWFLTPPNETGTAPAYRLMDWLSDLFSPKPERPTSPNAF